VNVNTTLNYLTNSAQAVQRFAGEALSKAQSGIQRKPWGKYASSYGPTSETIRSAVKGQGMGASDVAASTVLDALTNETRKDV